MDAALASLDQVSAPVAAALLSGIRGLAAGIPADAPPPVAVAARAAHARLVQHVARLATEGDPDPALGAAALAALMSSAEGIDVDLGRLAGRADAERDRLMARLAEDCARIDASRPPLELCRDLVRDHPGPDGVIDAARHWTSRPSSSPGTATWCPTTTGCAWSGPAPESRRWAMAMISTAAPGEPDAPSWFYVTPPEPGWPARRGGGVAGGVQRDHAARHRRARGRARALLARPGAAPGAGPVRRTLHSAAFLEGWAHYAEELCVEEGFRGDDPRFAIGVWLEALVRVTRLACAIGVHTAGMTVEEGARRFEADTHLTGPAALSEARRATFDPTYGRYTWGKLRDHGPAGAGPQAVGRRLHACSASTPRCWSLGSPPLGLLGTALDRG